MGTVRDELRIPDAAKFYSSSEVEGIHIAGMFGDAWCQDYFDEDTGDYAPGVGELFQENEPDSIDSMCKACVSVARMEE